MLTSHFLVQHDNIYLYKLLCQYVYFCSSVVEVFSKDKH